MGIRSARQGGSPVKGIRRNYDLRDQGRGYLGPGRQATRVKADEVLAGASDKAAHKDDG